MSTSTHLPLCVYCGTARPADQTRCPQCGRPWIDVRVGGITEANDRSRIPAMAGAAASATAVGVDKTATDGAPVPETQAIDGADGSPDDATPPPPETKTDSGDVPPPFATDDGSGDGSSQRFVWLIPALIAAAAVVVVALFGFGLLDDSEPVATPAPTTLPAPTTTVPATTTQAPTTTAAPTTTTTTTTIPAPASIPPVGDAVSMSALTLRTAGIGPILLGEPAADTIGRLVASLGRPEEIGVAGEELGLCAGEQGRFVRWAGLTAVVSGTIEDGTLAGYRYMDQAVPTMHLDFSTPSGLRVGDSVASLNEIYSAYQVDYVTDGGATIFRLSDADGLLLWGPLSSAEPTGRVEGIHSPDACTS